ncbi:MAG: TlpA family protein disulfide reductase [Deltaproteobacteria bacterium]|nr:TlpA family protein disulfide reductase [Deltaproteobacteria bacterium]
MARPARIAACFLVLLTVASPAFALCVAVGKPVPEVSLPSIDGGMMALSGLRGKIVLLAFWASWCPRCEEELTFLQGVYKTSPDIVVVAINQESQNISRAHIERIRKTLKDWRIDFPVLIDKNLDAWNAFCINALPTSIIVDKKGIVRYAEANYYWATQDKIAEVIQAIRLGK